MLAVVMSVMLLLTRESHTSAVFPCSDSNVYFLHPNFFTTPSSSSGSCVDYAVHPVHGENGIKTLILEKDRVTTITAESLAACQDVSNKSTIEAVSFYSGQAINKIEAIQPGALGSLRQMGFTNILQLSLYWNYMKSITSHTFRNLTELEILNIGGGNLKHLDPDAFATLAHLSHLDLSDNNIEHLEPKLFSGLPLHSLYLGNNLIASLMPKQFSELTQLQNLDIGNNLIKHLDPKSLALLTRLTHLKINGNILEDLVPRQFSELPRLQNLHLDNNNIRYLDGMMWQGLSPNVTTLELKGNAIQALTMHD